MNKNIACEESGYWGGDEFEDLVARSLIACYETKIAKKARRAPPCHRITDEDLQRIRSIGCYFAPADRVCYDSFIDIPQRDLPIEAIWAHADENNTGIMPENPDGIIHGYVDIKYCRKVTALPREIIRKGGGVPYEIVILYPMATQIDGIKLYCTVDKDGGVHATSRMVNFHDMATGMIKSIDVLGNNEDTSVTSLSATIGFYDDRKYLWNVQAIEGSARAMFGVYPEQIKSLFYARSLPLSATGRKRPILHWVEAHKRRIRNGIDIDIQKHLRGISSFEKDGTTFQITNPMKATPEQSVGMVRPVQ